MLYDSHCHLDQLDPELQDAALRGAVDSGVGAVLVAGVSEELWLARQALFARHAELRGSVGFHPWLAARSSDVELARELRAIERAFEDRACERVPARAVVALGETGLDRTADWATTRARQVEAFRKQLQLALGYGAPVVLHIVRAHGTALEVLADVGVPAGGVVHSWSGSPELVPAYLDLGLSISFAGTILDSPKLQAAARIVPADRLLVETDAPAQRPRSWGPGPNELSALPRFVAALAAARGEPVDVVARCTADNARRLFDRPLKPGDVP